MNDASGKTETGIDISNYISDRDSGSVRITKGTESAGNFVHRRNSYSIKMVGQSPTIVANAPELRNFNRKSIDELDAHLAEQAARINNFRLQIAAIISDMAALP